MFLKSEMRDFILDRPVGFDIPGKLQEVAVFVQSSRRDFSFLLFFFQLFLADGMRCRLNQSGVYGYSFVDGQALGGKL